MGQEKRAIPLLKHFLEKCISDTANFELGKCLNNSKNYVDAAHHFSKAIEINSKNPEYYLYRAETYEAMGFVKLACDDFRRYRTLYPTFGYSFEKKAKDCENFGNFVEANKIRNFIKKVQSS